MKLRNVKQNKKTEKEMKLDYFLLDWLKYGKS